MRSGSEKQTKGDAPTVSTIPASMDALSLQPADARTAYAEARRLSGKIVLAWRAGNQRWPTAAHCGYHLAR